MRYIVACLILWLCGTLTCSAQSYEISGKHPEVSFFYKDPINLSLYSWPRTLVSYQVVFSPEVDAERNFELIDANTNELVPFQLSDKKYEGKRLASARIHFFASLPSGGGYHYTLRLGDRQPISCPNPVGIKKEVDFWTVGNREFRVTIPSGSVTGGNCVPAPIGSVIRKDRSIGDNKLYSKHKRIENIQTSVIESGDLFVECEVCYKFEGGGDYRARVKVVQGYPFVILDEKMDRIEKEDSVFIDMKWERFAPSRKYVNWDRQKEVSVEDGIPIAQPTYTGYSQEDPYWTGMGWIEEVDKEMIYRLLPFGGNSTREQVPVMTFWETGGTAAELGVFVYDYCRWNDKQYGIWQPTPDLSVYFRYADRTLYFRYPLQAGTRSTAIALTRISEEQDKVDRFNRNIDVIAASGGKDNSKEMGFRYSMLLHRQYALLGLDRIKDWMLEYPEQAFRPKNPFVKRQKEISADEFYKQIVTSPMAYYMTGLNGFPGIHSISHRPLYSQWVQDYLTHYRQLSDEQRQTVEALFLMAGYVNMLEPMNAVRRSLAGTANMAADGWAVTGQMAFLFPEHPMAKEWGDYFQKMIEINGLFYTRPDVPLYELKGGRWVESLGIYNWAYLRPTVHSNIALEMYDGKNRFADSCMAQRACWMVDMITAGRSYPPHGAHGGGRLVPRFAPVYELGNWLQNYDPIVAENLRWLGQIGEDVEERPNDTKWVEVHKALHQTQDTGTNPHLRSCKYTGHGIVLRGGVDTDEEISIHLNQIDKGPNYRWGYQGQGNAGGLYFYTKDKVYTGHENEAVGDHSQNNTDGVTNFGVMKNGTFCNIGMNELIAPLYDLGSVQMAELRSATGKDVFSWPEYLSRSILLVGTDYFILYDQTGTNWRAFNRFSWFVQKQDEFPKIVFMGKIRPEYWSKAETGKSKGFYRDGVGSLLTLVTHKKESVQVTGGKVTVPSLLKGEEVYEFAPESPGHVEGVIQVATDKSQDLVFRNGNVIHYHSASVKFEGEAGVIRRMNSGNLELALLRGREIAADGFSILLEGESETAIALTYASDGNCRGRFKSDGKASLTLGGLNRGKLYLDGVLCKVQGTALKLPQGEHVIEYSKQKAMPMPTVIKEVVYTKEGADVFISKPAGVTKVRMEISGDGGKKWRTLGTTEKAVYSLSGLEKGKYHVRAVSVNGEKEADFAAEYPVYMTGLPTHSPDGLKLRLAPGEVRVSWGKVLGTDYYRLYRRKLGESNFKIVYEGKLLVYNDKDAKGVVPPFELPRSLDNVNTDRNGITIYEYTVTAVNGNGESQKTDIVNTDPASWLNWYPDTEWRFKRRSAFWMEPYVLPNRVPDMYYPD
ncbi:hypothetical protein [Bacteroides sp.]